ncbi:FAS1-like dehydratase domain-containing protein [Billgrantia gudaonensis]|uniref:Itaconyl-CoA hydratase / mesaconyl-C4 CoA hydratase n=1 Tax=Billgrantia gudaonensis TaxID=376427 RepID=A0A1G9BW99_9GAMM|nr:MaoC family dehydratase N-terminal domain-containing protein [Halomonas gudaonensis]SDK43712.1 itaconyl-CoA hydratase / mesaconyl-C4 CoA hydratase [Halomonas gudaonensis]
MTDDTLSSWIGKRETSHDRLSLELAKRIATTLGDDIPTADAPLPHLWHWAFFQEPVSEACLGRDGHPRQGMLLPPIDGKNRMWAGGRVHFHRPLRIGEPARRQSTITAVDEKQGKSGELLFVTVQHRYYQHDRLCIGEEQSIVYREPKPATQPGSRPVPRVEWKETIAPSPVLLFRYSAITYNSHRIHYDQQYATEVEGYPGLVVHGPMIATFMLRSFTRRFPQRRPIAFTYRGIRPLFASTPFHVGGHHSSATHCALHAYDADGPAHQAEIEYKENA